MFKTGTEQLQSIRNNPLAIILSLQRASYWHAQQRLWQSQQSHALYDTSTLEKCEVVNPTMARCKITCMDLSHILQPTMSFRVHPVCLL